MENANWAIEGAYCFGKPFANYLIKNNCKVFEINPFITKSEKMPCKTADKLYLQSIKRSMMR